MVFGTVDHCLLIETDHGSLVLVDTGFGTQCVRRPETVGWTRHIVRPALRPEQTAVAQIQALGLDPTDVRDVVLTHLDYDHTGGLADFPWAAVHIHDLELEAGMRPGLVRRVRYRPDHMWAHGVDWRVHQLDGVGGRTWMGLPGVRELPGVQAALLVVPLPGHTDGHIGVAVETDHGWLLHAGDSYMSRFELRSDTAGRLSRAAYTLYGHPSKSKAQRDTSIRLRELLVEHPEVTTFCSHDRGEFEGLTSV